MVMLFQVSFFSQGGPNIGPIVSGQIWAALFADGELNLTHGSCSARERSAEQLRQLGLLGALGGLARRSAGSRPPTRR